MRAVNLLTLALVALVAVPAAGCGGGEKSDQGEAKTVIEEEDQRHAESVVLTLSDLPSGWRAKPSGDGDDAEDGEFECVSFDFSDLTQNGRAESDEFSMQNAEVSSSATVYEDEEQASAAVDRGLEILKGEEFRSCFERFMKKEVESEDVQIGEVSVGEVSFPELADRTDAIQVEVPVTAEGQSGSVYLDFVVMQDEDTLAAINFIDVLTPFDQQLKEELAEKVAARMPRD